MLFGFIDRVTLASPLRTALDQSATRARGIADRVAKASLDNGEGFALRAGEGDFVAEGANAVDTEQEMMDLADEQLRFVATAKLLEKTYQSLRSAIRSSGS